MSDYKTVAFSLGSDVANGGTFTANYPNNTQDGDFENATGHYLVINGATLYQPKDIGITFNDTNMTITNRTGGAIVAGNGNMTLMYLGADSFDKSIASPVGVVQNIGTRKMYPRFIDFGSPITLDTDGICESQSVTAATQAVINGDATGINGAASGKVIIPPYGRALTAAWTGTAILTVIGTDFYGNAMTESSGSGTSFTGKKAFYTVTSILLSANVTSFVLGFSDILGLPVAVPSTAAVLNEYQAWVPRPRKPGYIRVGWQALGATMDAATSIYITPGFAGTIVDAGLATGNGTVTTGGDVTFTVSGVAVAGLTLTVANSAGAGTIYTDTPTLGDASTAVAATDYISIVPASAINGCTDCIGWVGIQPTSALSASTFVPALTKDTKSTATTNDVRGTYKPEATCDGTTSFQLAVLLSQPGDIGSAQYNA